jgi:hypothetical protein
MRRKTPPKIDTVVPPELLERAKRAVSVDRIKAPAKCLVCGADTEIFAEAEALCWVCRRLKISAWRDVETQAPMQE